MLNTDPYWTLDNQLYNKIALRYPHFGSRNIRQFRNEMDGWADAQIADRITQLDTIHGPGVNAAPANDFQEAGCLDCADRHSAPYEA